MDKVISTYLGVEVEASKCDYKSFEQLGLRCPYCDSPMILVDEFGRLTPKSKEISIVPRFFRHTQAVDKARAAECQARSLTPEGREHLRKLAATARGQRLKKFQRRFWSMVSQSYKVKHWLEERDRFAGIMSESTLTEAIILREYLDEFRATLKHSLQNGTFQKAIEEWCHQLLGDPFPLSQQYENPRLWEALDRLKATTNREYQALVAGEAAWYLTAPSATGALGELFLCGFTFSSPTFNKMFHALDAEEELARPRWPSKPDRADLAERKRELIYREVNASLVVILITVPWAEALSMDNLTPANAAIAKEARSQK